jgi:DUF2911 family protein
MKKYFAPITLLVLLIRISSTQAQEFRGLDDSPMDRAYLPDNFAHDRKFAPERNLGESAIIKVVYSRPQKKGREVFGNLVKYDELWRLGANEATEIKLYQDLKIGGKEIKKGRYSLFAIPAKTEWIIIFNTDLDRWGHYSYDKSNDELRVKATVKPNSKVVEAMSIQFEDLGNNKAVMRFAWDKTIAELPISY